MQEMFAAVWDHHRQRKAAKALAGASLEREGSDREIKALDSAVRDAASDSEADDSSAPKLAAKKQSCGCLGKKVRPE